MIMVPRYLLKICLPNFFGKSKMEENAKNPKKFVKRHSEQVGKKFKLTGK